jgi:hypothetical protein
MRVTSSHGDPTRIAVCWDRAGKESVMRNIRTGAALLACVLAAGFTGVAAPVQARPQIYHTIFSSFAGASFTVQEGCLSQQVYVSAARGQYAAQPGPVGKQARTSILFIVTDVCSTARAAAGAAAGGGGTVLLDAMGEVAVAPRLAPRLGSATLEATVPLLDAISGSTFMADIRVTWTATGPMDHDTVHVNVLFPKAGSIHSSANDKRREATATLSMSSGAFTLEATTDEAVLELIKARCMEVVWPKYSGESTWCFGIPG